MSVVTGLDAIRNRAAQRGSGGGTSRKDTFLKLEDGDVKKIWFLQELDEASPHYNEEAGLGALVVEFRDPDNFRRRIVDSSDEEGRCWAAEQGWKPRLSLYISVYVEDDDEVRVLNQGFGPKTVVDWLVEYAGDAGSITNTPFKIRRKGAGMRDTEYTLTPAGVPTDPKVDDIGADKVFDVDDLVNKIPYAEQEAFFQAGKQQEESSSASSDSAW